MYFASLFLSESSGGHHNQVSIVIFFLSLKCVIAKATLESHLDTWEHIQLQTLGKVWAKRKKSSKRSNVLWVAEFMQQILDIISLDISKSMMDTTE